MAHIIEVSTGLRVNVTKDNNIKQTERQHLSRTNRDMSYFYVPYVELFESYVNSVSIVNFKFN